MKKKNLLMMALSLCLVAVVAVGGTLAYLSDSVAPIKNTFKFGSITVAVSEAVPAAVKDETIVSDGKGGLTYTNVVPGQDLNKEPKVSVTSSVDAYVFVKVEVTNNTITLPANAMAGWTPLGGHDDVYYMAVEGQTASRDLGALFSTVTVADDLDGDETLADITISVAAIQQAGFTDAADAFGEVTFQEA